MEKGSIFAHGSPQQLPRSAVSRTSARKGERKRHTVWTDPQHMTAMVGFAGFDNKAPLRPVPALLDGPYGSPQATCDLRRKNIIVRIPNTNRYQLIPLGRSVASIFTKTCGRVLAPGLVEFDLCLPEGVARRSPLAQAWRNLDRGLDDYINDQLIAA